MTTYTDICEAVRECGLCFQRAGLDPALPVPQLPYVLLLPQGSDDVYADAGNYRKRTQYVVQLYERGSSTDLEGRLEGAMEAHGLAYVRRDVPMGDGVHQVEYTTTVTGR